MSKIHIVQIDEHVLSFEFKFRALDGLIIDRLHHDKIAA